MGLFTLCRSVFDDCFRSSGEISVRLSSTSEIWVRLRYAGEFLGSVNDVEVKFRVRLPYAGHLLGPPCGVSTLYR